MQIITSEDLSYLLDDDGELIGISLDWLAEAVGYPKSSLKTLINSKVVWLRPFLLTGTPIIKIKDNEWVSDALTERIVRYYAFEHLPVSRKALNTFTKFSRMYFCVSPSRLRDKNQ